MRRSRSLESLHAPTCLPALTAPLTLVRAEARVLSPIQQLRAEGAFVNEVTDINPRGVNDAWVVARNGDAENAWTAFAVGRDSVAQASALLERALQSVMVEGRTPEIVLRHEAASAAIVEQLLRAIYFTPVTPTLDNGLEIQAVIEYLGVSTAPNPVLRTLATASSTVVTAGLNKQNAESIFRRAVAVHNEDVQQRAIRVLDLTGDFKLRASNFSQEELHALVSNPALRFAEPEPESNVLDLLWRWAQAHSEYPDIPSQSQCLRAADLVRCVRWITVRDAAIYESQERGLLTDADVGRIMRARFLKAANRPEFATYKLFDQPIVPPRG